MAQGGNSMKAQAIVDVANKAGTALVKWVPMERVLTIVCVLSPLVMWRIDPGPLRGSISAYFAMMENQWFYVPLAIGAMLFIVNGITRQGHWYNWVLGGALVGLLMVHTPLPAHIVFAVIFFAGNVAVMIWWSDAPAEFRYGFAAVIGLIAVGTLAAGVLTLWWAEFISLLIIGAHFLLDSLPGKRWAWYKALPRGVNPWSRANLQEVRISGELYRRRDRKWAFRIKASNGQIVATDGQQGYESKSDARYTLEKVLRGEYDGAIEEVG